MDTIRDQFGTGRRDMLDAFVALSGLARRAGVDDDEISDIHGKFFDGNVAIKESFGALCAVTPHPPAGPGTAPPPA